MPVARSCTGVVAALRLTSSSAAIAQVTTADIVGRVTDSSGAVLPGVSVTVENVGTHETRVVPTHESGDYTVTLLPIGTYTVNIGLQGFSRGRCSSPRRSCSDTAAMTRTRPAGVAVARGFGRASRKGGRRMGGPAVIALRPQNAVPIGALF